MSNPPVLVLSLDTDLGRRRRSAIGLSDWTWIPGALPEEVSEFVKDHWHPGRFSAERNARIRGGFCAHLNAWKALAAEGSPEAIILEDDCLPDESFFPYCEEMLARYRHDQRVMMISGYSFLDLPEAARQSYFFSYLGSTWGWATWRRAWALNDPLMARLPQVIEARLIEHLFPDPVHSRFWYDVLARISDGRLRDAWDYQWQLTCWYNSGYRIFPGVNMISNIGI